ncbi:MAG: cob(I)yrinic acid a,c-diamide adenosyltransferase [Deltaproteobacteria bacterium]|nr:cob(I)yrinic acid a,c-diamide adenosyltransferase [Deltaproteobacteria bacterium]
MRITKVYTRTGDKGLTRLVGGQKVRKDDVRIESYGTVDELNTVVGLVRMELARSEADEQARTWLDARLAEIQNDLFNLGSDLATKAEDRWEGMRLVEPRDVKRLEDEIDHMNEILPALKDFILPGGGPVSAFTHQGRTVCRRAERRVIGLAADEEINEQAVKFLNRLSDWLFVAGRWVAKAMGEAEFLWNRER